GVRSTMLKKIGDQVSKGETLAVVRFAEPQRWERQRSHLQTAWEIGADAVDTPGLVIDRTGRRGTAVPSASPRTRSHTLDESCRVRKADSRSLHSIQAGGGNGLAAPTKRPGPR